MKNGIKVEVNKKKLAKLSAVVFVISFFSALFFFDRMNSTGTIVSAIVMLASALLTFACVNK